MLCATVWYGFRLRHNLLHAPRRYGTFHNEHWPAARSSQRHLSSHAASNHRTWPTRPPGHRVTRTPDGTLHQYQRAASPALTHFRHLQLSCPDLVDCAPRVSDSSRPRGTCAISIELVSPDNHGDPLCLRRLAEASPLPSRKMNLTVGVATPSERLHGSAFGKATAVPLRARSIAIVLRTSTTSSPR